MSTTASQTDLITQFQPAFALGQRWLSAYAILLARPLAMLSVNPVFTRTELTNLMKGIIATGLLFPMWPLTASMMPAELPGLSSLFMIALKETLIGVAIGLPLGLPFWMLLAAGDIVDQQRGATQGRLNDPTGFGDFSVSGTLFLLCGIVILTASGHLDVFADTLYASWRVWHPLELLPAMPNQQAANLALSILDALQIGALDLGAPLILAMLLTDVAMLLVARLAPQLHVDSLSTPVRNLVFFVMLPLYASFLLFYMAKTESGIGNVVQLLTSVLHSSGGGTQAP